MITFENSIPTKSDAFLKGLDIIYSQFNDISFFIEDEDQENFYYQILKKLFPAIRLNKIFPLRGKSNVIAESQRGNNQANKTKVFLVDKDFDDLLGTIIDQPNLFYLKMYSIENYLINELAFTEYIKDEKPKLKPQEISKGFRYLPQLKRAARLFREITLLQLLIQSKNLAIRNTSYPPDRFIVFGKNVAINKAEITKYRSEIELELKKLDRRITLRAQLTKLNQRCGLKTWQAIITHTPGKNLIKYFKHSIEHTFSINNRNSESFNFRLARYNDFSSLDFLRNAVQEYVN